MKRILLMLMTILCFGIAANCQTVTEYSSVLQSNGYSISITQMDNTTLTLEKIAAPNSYIVVIEKDGDKIDNVTVIALISQIGNYSFKELEPVKLYPQYFETPQIVGDLFLFVEPFIPQIEIKGNTVQLAAMYKPLAPILKE